MNIEALKQDFLARYGSSTTAIFVYFSPGRVNLIGEHTDYNGGYVLPCALSYGTYLLARVRKDFVFRFASTNMDFETTVELSETAKKQGQEWVNYPLGVIEQFKAKNKNLGGLDLLYSGNIPNGAGLSSSASIELVTSVALNDLFGANFLMLDMVKLSQKAENEFVGVNCGIMDQFAVGMGQKDHALALKCDTLEYEAVPLKLAGYKIVISNTNKRRGLADSKYNERRAECEKAVEYLQKTEKIEQLGDLSWERFLEIQDQIPDPVVKKRARHVVSENQRVIDALQALKNDDLTAFGKLMNQSHDSLRDDYEVTGKELDTLVNEALKIDGVLGSRMTGAGFGGCTVSLVREDKVEDFTGRVGKNYEQKTGLAPDFYIADISDGAKRVL